MNNKKGIIVFDLDGTLINSAPDLCNALNQTLGAGALKKFDEDAQKNMQSMNQNAENLYYNFKSIL